jgi:signal transduction histidine kinase
MEAFKNLLAAVHSPLIASTEATGQLMRQVDAVLDDVAVAVLGRQVTGSGARRLGSEIGASRADHGVPPIESLRASAVLFEVLLPVVLAELAARGVDEQTRLTAITALHRSLAYRIELGAMAYASFLRQKVNSSHRDERRRIARELHDRAAPAVGVALQDLELHDIYVNTDPGRARGRIGTARTALREALDVVRQVAQELRESVVETGGLERSLAQYIESRVPPQIETTLSVTGDEQIPDEVGEELYVVLREAIRNAVLHAQARTLDVTVIVKDGEIHSTVRDDGKGFDVSEGLVTQTGIGLSSMRERLELLDGTLMINSQPGAGTVISMLVANPGSSA